MKHGGTVNMFSFVIQIPSSLRRNTSARNKTIADRSCDTRGKPYFTAGTMTITLRN